MLNLFPEAGIVGTHVGRRWSLAIAQRSPWPADLRCSSSRQLQALHFVVLLCARDGGRSDFGKLTSLPPACPRGSCGWLLLSRFFPWRLSRTEIKVHLDAFKADRVTGGLAGDNLNRSCWESFLDRLMIRN